MALDEMSRLLFLILPGFQ